MIKYPQQIGRDGDLKPVPIAEKTAKNLNGVASHPIIFRVLLWQIKIPKINYNAFVSTDVKK